MQLHGAWPEALEEARRAGRALRAGDEPSRRPREALYRQGEVHRLRGEFAAAEEAYREREPGGCEPQPGLALLRLAQGDGEAAAAAIRRAVGETADPSTRVAAAAGPGRDHARGRRCSRRRAAPAASSRRSPSAGRARMVARWSRTPGERSTSPRATPGPRWSRCGRAGAGVARARGALRGGPRARAGGAGLRGARRRRRGRAGARGRARGLRTARSGAGPRPRRRAHRPRAGRALRMG